MVVGLGVRSLSRSVGLGADVRGFDLLTRSASRSNAPTSPRRRSEGQRDGGSRLQRVSRPTFELPLLPTHRKCQWSGGRPARRRGARVLTSALSLAADAALPPGEVWTILSMRAGGPGAWSARCACGAAPALRALRYLQRVRTRSRPTAPWRDQRLTSGAVSHMIPSWLSA
jgi:hypothetical protein